MTGGADRTLRYWDLETGELWDTIQTPIGPDRVGEITAVTTLGSNNTLFAAKPPTRDEGIRGAQSVIYATRNRNGAIFARRFPVTSTIVGLSHWKEGRLTAAVVGNSVFVLDRKLAELSSQSFGSALVDAVVFSAQGQLAVVTNEGEVTVFDVVAETGQLEQRFAYRHGQGVAAGVAFSPDGQTLAVGYRERAGVLVLSVATGKALRRLSISNAVVGGGSLNRLAWAGLADGSDGTTLYAGGTLEVDGSNAVVAWRDGDGAGLALPVARDSIRGLTPLPDGSVLFASSFPEWGRLDPQAQGGDLERVAPAVLRYRISAPKHDFRMANVDGQFSISPDGSHVRIAVRDEGASDSRWIGFDFRNTSRIDPAPETLANHAPVATSGALKVEGLREFVRNLKVGGRTIVMDTERRVAPGERALSVDVAQTADAVLLGTDFALMLVDSDGRVVARREVASAAWAVALAPRGRLAVVAHGDGSVRWYSLREDSLLEEIAGAFLHAEDGRWVAWRADGRFAHSESGGADLGGFAVNRLRRDAEGRIADRASGWAAMAELYGELYRRAETAGVFDQPETWARIASRRDLSQRLLALAWFDAKPAAVCDFGAAPGEAGCMNAAEVAPVTGMTIVEEWPETEFIQVHLDLPHDAAPVERVRIYRNGVIAGVTEKSDLTLTPTEDGRRLTVNLSAIGGENALSARLYAASGRYEDVEIATLKLDPVKTERVLHILAVAIADYQIEGFELVSAANDAAAISDLISHAASRDAYDFIAEPKLLQNKYAGKAEILQAIDELSRSVDANDTVIVYLAGHGETRDGDYVFLHYDLTSKETMFEEGLSGDALTLAISTIGAASMLLIIDTCYAGAIEHDAVANFAHNTQTYFLMSSNSTEKAQDLVQGSENGPLAHLLLEGMKGAAALASGTTVDANALALYVMERIPSIVADPPEPIFRTGSGRIGRLPLVDIQ